MDPGPDRKFMDGTSSEMNGTQMRSAKASHSKSTFALALLTGTILTGLPAAAMAQDTGQEAALPTGQAGPEAQGGAAPVQAQADVIQTIAVSGAQRLEPQTILSYISIRPGQTYTAALGDQTLKELADTELFSDFSIRNERGNVIITVVENPVINRIILEGNDRLDNDKILPEIKLAPRQIFTRSKTRADVARIIELYKRQGRFAATVEPKVVELSQNRVDLVFEISEGPKSKVRQINIIGNEVFSDGTLRGEMVTKQARLTSFLSSNTSYDPDRLAFDQQKLREFYLTEGYVDFRVVSAVAELTPDKRDFIITYVVEEGEKYDFGDVEVESQLRDFSSEGLSANLPMKTGDGYNAKLVEDTVEQLSELAGTFGYAFADVQPQFSRNRDSKTMDVTFLISEAPRVYVERVDINGNTLTQDKVIRREMRINEGDAFNSLQVARSTNRINSLGFFQENFEIEQKEGSAPDRIVLEANVEDQPTGELQLSAGFSSIESFLLSASIRERNFRGRGQTVGASVNWSRFSRSFGVNFTEPYVFDRNISAGVDLYRRDFSSFNFRNNDRNTTFEQTTTGGAVRLGVPLTEYMSLIGSYTLNYDDITLDENQFFADFDGDGISTCEPLLAGRFLCDSIGQRTSSIAGLTLNYNSLNSRFRPSRGERISVTAEYAGLGGSVEYARIRGNAAKYWNVFNGFIFSLSAEGGYIKGLQDRGGAGVDDVLLTDRFFLGEPQIRGFDIRGVGPRVLRQPIVDDGEGNPLIITDRNRVADDAIGGNAYYLGRAELEIPLGSGVRELGLRPSIFMDVGALFNVTEPVLTQSPFPGGLSFQQTDGDGNPLFVSPEGLPTLDAVQENGTPNQPLNQTIDPFQEVFLGDSAAPRISVGIGVNWNSPFGPFRIDFAKVLKKQPGDDTKTLSFNVGTQF